MNTYHTLSVHVNFFQGVCQAGGEMLQDHSIVSLNALKTRDLSVPPIRHSGMFLAGIQRLKNQCLLDSGFRRNDELAVDFAEVLRWSCRVGMPGSAPFLSATGMASHVLTKHPIHSRLPTLTRRLKILHNFRTIAHGHQSLLIRGFWPTTARLDWNHGL